jgi:cytochrome P450 family 12
LESIGLITLNRRLGVMENPEASKINQLIKKVFELSFEYDVLPGIWRTFKTPGFWKVMRTYENLTGTMKQYADEAMKEIDNAQTVNVEDSGILEKLMKIDRHVAFVMVLDSLIAGVSCSDLFEFCFSELYFQVDTTTSGAVSTLYGLAKNPDKQEILRQEVLKILPEKSSKLTMQSLNSIPYLRAVIKEGLRLHPPINGNLRAAGQDLVIKGYQIPADVSETYVHLPT